MPRKLRQLKKDLRAAGFTEQAKRGKGSHTRWKHPAGPYVDLSGHDGEDAHHYQEDEVRNAIREARKRSNRP